MEGVISVAMGLAYPVRDVEVSRIHMIGGKGMTCEKPCIRTCLSRSTVAAVQGSESISPGS